MSGRGRVIVLGILGRFPVAGVTWQVLQYLEGLRRLGFDVYYAEDTGAWPYHPGYTVEDQKHPPPERDQYAVNTRYAVDFVADALARYGFADRWMYRARINDGWFGVPQKAWSDLLATADILINLTGSTRLAELPEAYRRVPVRVYLETDPVMVQVDLARGEPKAIEMMDEHTHHFSYGENFGAHDCRVPIVGYRFRPTRPPVVLDWWNGQGAANAITRAAAEPATYTTIASWLQLGNDLVWNGERYLWSKHWEFLKILDLPRRARVPIELALLFGNPEEAAEAIPVLEGHGWGVRDALALSSSILPYRDYIVGSRAEFTVAKDQNIRLRSGWFSDRSACYLAAGRPVVTQDTAFGNVLPTGSGLFAWRTMDDVLAAFDAIESDYPAQRAAAREIAAEHFAAEKVLARLVEELGA